MAHSTEPHGEAGERTHEPAVLLPAPTFSPIIFAFGLTLAFAGVMTQWTVSAVGLVIAFFGAIRWWHAVIPQRSARTFAHQPAPASGAHRGRTSLGRSPARG